MNHKRAAATVPLLCLSLAACSGGDSSNTSNSHASSKSSGPALPNVTWQPLTTAETTLSTAGLTDQPRDASPLDRSVWSRKNWTVISSSPAAGQAYTAGQAITLNVLKNDEAAWYRANPTMPKVSSTDQLATLSGMLQYVYAPGTAPASATPPATTPDTTGLSAADAATVKDLKGSDQSNPFVGTIPKAGSKLAPGQVIYVLTKPAPESSPEPSASSDGPLSTSTNSGGVNVPNPNLPNHLPHIHKHW